jgi:DnaJ family protein A protein 5
VAYEILSDVQERAWYDLHTDAILGNQQGPSNGYYEYGTRITTAEDIVRLFTRLDERLEFSDGPSGFYTTIRELFDELAREEEIACQRAGLGAVDYPSFGSAKDSYENVVRPFYVIWSGFATKKSFNCKDRFRYSDAPDRCARRMMEKENKKLRGESVREFNDSIRSLVAFIKRRDPRYLSNRQSDSERQKALREQAASQAARARAENQAKLDREVVPEWANIQAPAENEMEEDLVDDEPLQHFECVVCDKTFKSEKQYNTHEKSRKHTKAIQYFRRIMKSEDVTLGHDTPRQISLAIPINEVAKKEYVKNRVSNRNIDNEESSSGHKPAAKPTAKTVVNQNDDLYIVSSVESDDEYALREIVTERIFHDATAEIDVNKLSQGLIIKTVEDQDTQTNRVKPGKAKMKRAKKAAATTVNDAKPEVSQCPSLAVEF